jgi:UDP-glucose 4-epimerase
MPRLLVLGAGYLGTALAEHALAAGDTVTLADNWYATERRQLTPLERRGASVETADVRAPDDLRRLLSRDFERVYLLAAQASRPISFEDPTYTEQTNLVGPRLVVDALIAHEVSALVFASSLHVYGTSPAGEIDADHPYGAQGDLSHLSKVYAELLLRMRAEREPFDLAILRLGIVYGPSPAQHSRPESETVVDKFRRLSGEGKPLPIEDGGRATIGVVHIEDAARILHGAPSEPGVSVANVAAEATTVEAVAALASGREPQTRAAAAFRTPFSYRHRLAEYLG